MKTKEKKIIEKRKTSQFKCTISKCDRRWESMKGTYLSSACELSMFIRWQSNAAMICRRTIFYSWHFIININRQGERSTKHRTDHQSRSVYHHLKKKIYIYINMKLEKNYFVKTRFVVSFSLVFRLCISLSVYFVFFVVFSIWTIVSTLTWQAPCLRVLFSPRASSGRIPLSSVAWAFAEKS